MEDLFRIIICWLVIEEIFYRLDPSQPPDLKECYNITPGPAQVCKHYRVMLTKQLCCLVDLARCELSF